MPARSTQRFFSFALGWTLLLQLPAALTRLGLVDVPVDVGMNLLALGVFGPVLGAVVAAWREGGRARAKEIFWPPMRGLSPLWLLLALVLFPIFASLGCLVCRVLGYDVPLAYPIENAQQVAGAIMMPWVEEPGWRGFAMPRLSDRHGPLRASLIVGALWAAWHTMMFIVQWGPSLAVFAMGVVNIVVGSVVFGWLYVRTRGSLLAAYLAHVGAHLNSPAHALPGAPAAFVAWTVVVAVAAIALVVLDRDAWRAR